MARASNGYWELHAPDVRPGDRYAYRLDGDRTLPDPASRFQPEGVHGPSQVIDPRAFGVDRHGVDGHRRSSTLIIYELHVGTFSPAGHVRRRRGEARRGGATRRDGDRDHAGRRVSGRAQLGLRRRRTCSRRRGRTARPTTCARWSTRRTRSAWPSSSTSSTTTSGPEGAYLTAYSPRLLHRPASAARGAQASTSMASARSTCGRSSSRTRSTGWSEYHVDGLRLDATHALCDDGPHHFLAEFVTRVRDVPPARHRHRRRRAQAAPHGALAGRGRVGARRGVGRRLPPPRAPPARRRPRGLLRGVQRHACPISRGRSRAGGSCAGPTTTDRGGAGGATRPSAECRRST